jgi:hypothetical protein
MLILNGNCVIINDVCSALWGGMCVDANMDASASSWYVFHDDWHIKIKKR